MSGEAKTKNKTRPRSAISMPIGDATEAEGGALWGFMMNAGGLFKRIQTKTDEGIKEHLERVSTAFRILGLVRDDASDSWGLLIVWADPDGLDHDCVVPFALATGDAGRLVETLSNGGLLVSPLRRHKTWLQQYLAGARTAEKRRIRSVSATGWHGSSFILPSGEVIGRGNLHFAGGRDPAACTVAGTFEAWREHVAGVAPGNPFLTFAIASAFLAPLLPFLNPDAQGGFHIYGSSSTGKTTVAIAALSVWKSGEPHSWHSTSAGLEGISSRHNHALLVLDELNQAGAREVEALAYMLFNGVGRQRAGTDAKALKTQSWKLVSFSTGEIDLETKLKELGCKLRAGQEVRLVNIPIDAQRGCFNDLHHYREAGKFAEDLKSAAKANGGHAIKQFLEKLTADPQTIKADIERLHAECFALMQVSETGGQARRVAYRMAAVGMAGRLAARWGILPWSESEAPNTAAEMFCLWIKTRGTPNDLESYQTIKNVFAFLEANANARFDTWDAGGIERVINRAGTRRFSKGEDGKETVDFYLTGEGLSEAAGGGRPSAIAKTLAEAGYLVKTQSGSYARAVRVPGHPPNSLYHITDAAIVKYHDWKEEDKEAEADNGH